MVEIDDVLLVDEIIDEIVYSQLKTECIMLVEDEDEVLAPQVIMRLFECDEQDEVEVVVEYLAHILNRMLDELEQLDNEITEGIMYVVVPVQVYDEVDDDEVLEVLDVADIM